MTGDRCPECGAEWVSFAYHGGPQDCPLGVKFPHVCHGCARCGHAWHERLRTAGAS